MSSAMAIVGWVSFSWMATLSGNEVHGSRSLRKRRQMSWSEAEHQKYCCFNLSSRPASWFSLRLERRQLELCESMRAREGRERTHEGYRTRVMVSASSASRTAAS